MMENIKHFIDENDQFSRHSGIELLEAAAGYAKAKMVIRDYHLNGAKMVHGGAIFTLADHTFAAAANSRGRVALSINAAITFIKATSTGVLFAEAREISLNHTLGNYIVTVVNEQNEVVATFQGSAYRKQEELLNRH